nr:esterase FE4-like [Leptinotarsa decemlineata]
MHKITVLSLLTFFSLNLEVYCDECPIVTTPLGKIKGSIQKSRLGRTIYSYRGIRYAKPPINDLRFQPPQPIGKWEGVFDATKDGPLCSQPKIFGNSSEDCLTLNVYTTKLPSFWSNPKRPVIVDFPGGSFFIGGASSNQMGPNYFMDQDIVLISFNYRLASLGYLSTGDKHAPGNNGYKDQVVLLKWVKNNIEHFGGDPNSVTLFGFSAGGWCSLLHMVSPMSEGLFHKAVSMSGNSVGIFPIQNNQLELAKKQARLVGCPDDTSENIVNCLKRVPAEQLAESLFGFQEFGSDPVVIWGPVIEGKFGQQQFLPDHPIRLIMKGQFQKVPYITGQTKDEIGIKSYEVIDNATLTKEMNDDFETIAPISFIYERNTSHSKKVSRAIKSFYFGNRPLDKSQLKNLGNVGIEGFMSMSVNKCAVLVQIIQINPVYNLICFSTSPFYFHATFSGVSHGDDLSYLFYDSRNFPLFGKDSPRPEIDMVEKLTTMFANFARTGNPIPHRSAKLDNVKWDRFTLQTQKYMDIGNRLVMKERLFEERNEFWENLYPLSFYAKSN